MRPETIEFTSGVPVRAVVRRGNRYPFHWHDALEIVEVLKGSVSIGIGDDDLVLREADIAITNMGEIHRMTGDGQDEILIIHVNSDFCRSVLPDRYLFIYCCSPYHEAQAPGKYGVLKNYVARLTVLLAHDKIQGGTLQELLREMLAFVAYNFDFIRWGYGTQAFDNKRVKRLRKMAEHVTSDAEIKMGLTALASEVGVTPQHLSGDIKAKFGMTLQELLCYTRCEQAAKLLLGTDRHIIQIAADSGFSDNKYLVKYFKRFFHTTPHGFRKAFQASAADLAAQTVYQDLPLSHALGCLRESAAEDRGE